MDAGPLPVVVSLHRRGRRRYDFGMEPVNLAEFEKVARARLARETYDYCADVANDEVTPRANREAYGKLSLYHRVLHNVAAGTLRSMCSGSGFLFR